MHGCGCASADKDVMYKKTAQGVGRQYGHHGAPDGTMGGTTAAGVMAGTRAPMGDEGTANASVCAGVRGRVRVGVGGRPRRLLANRSRRAANTQQHRPAPPQGPPTVQTCRQGVVKAIRGAWW